MITIKTCKGVIEVDNTKDVPNDFTNTIQEFQHYAANYLRW